MGSIKDTDKGYADLVRRAGFSGKIKVGILEEAGAALHGESAGGKPAAPKGRDAKGRFTRSGARAPQGRQQGGSQQGGKMPVTVLDIATWMEFGTGHIPARSFLRAWFDENAAQCRQDLQNLAKQVIAGKLTKERAYELLGLKWAGQIQKRIAAGIAPPNALNTVKKKGSSKPLIDTGQLRSSVTHEHTED